MTIKKNVLLLPKSTFPLVTPPVTNQLPPTAIDMPLVQGEQPPKVKGLHGYESFANTHSGRRAESLLRSHATKLKHIYETVLLNVSPALPFLDIGRRHTAKEFFDDKLWLSWSFAERRVAGMCLTFMVKHQIIPLSMHKTKSGKGSKKYYLAKEIEESSRALT